MPDLVAVFLIGLLGSMHCVGMCGGFVLALSQHGRAARRLHAHQTLYFLGKALTYAALGAVTGSLGHLVGTAFAGMQSTLSIVLGVFLVGVGLGLLGVLNPFEGSRFLARWNTLPALLGRFLKRRTYAATFGLGTVNGLLP